MFQILLFPFGFYKSIQVGRDTRWILYYMSITITFLFLLILREIKIEKELIGPSCKCHGVQALYLMNK